MAQRTFRFGLSSAKPARAVLDWEQAQHEPFLSDKSLIGTVAVLVGMNLWFDIVILYLDMDRIAALL